MTSSTLAATDPHNTTGENLDTLGQMPSFNQWIFDTLRPYLGSSLIEVGSGNARFSAMMLELPHVRRYFGIDITPSSAKPIDLLASAHPDKAVAFQCVDLEKEKLKFIVKEPVETIVCLNVLEHLRDDRAVLEDFASVLKPGGYLILQVPAFQWLYGSIDEAIGHCRRYTKRPLADLVRGSGFDVKSCFYFNLVGVLAWIWHVKIRGLRVHPQGEMRLADRLVPLFRSFESLVPIPAGLSLFLMASKKRPGA